MRPLLLVFALVLMAAPAAAQIQFGAQANYADDFDFGIGARALFDTGDIVESTRVAGSFDLYFPGDSFGDADVTFWEINANAHYLFPLDNSPVDVYAGAGLHFAKVSIDFDDEVLNGFLGDVDTDESEIGLNLLGGVEFPLEAAPVKPFAEIKIELGGAEQFVLTGGVLF